MMLWLVVAWFACVAVVFHGIRVAPFLDEPDTLVADDPRHLAA